MVALLSAFATGSVALRKTDTKVTAENLARNQMEFTKSQQFSAAPATYTAITPLPEGYSVSAEAASVTGRDSNIQKVTVTVRRKGNAVYTLEDFKLNQ